MTDSYSGVGTIACVYSIGTLTADTWSNSRLAPTELALNCGSSRAISGTTIPYGSSDWFKVTWTPTAVCQTLHIHFTSDLYNLARFDITDANGIQQNGDGEHVNGTQFNTSVSGLNPVWIRVWAPYVGLTYTLSIDNT